MDSSLVLKKKQILKINEHLSSISDIDSIDELPVELKVAKYVMYVYDTELILSSDKSSGTTLRFVIPSEFVTEF